MYVVRKRAVQDAVHEVERQGDQGVSAAERRPVQVVLEKDGHGAASL
jgi:hypothetical protein